MGDQVKQDGGPAFPLQDWDSSIHAKRFETGMALRDWFAGQVASQLAAAMLNEGNSAIHDADTIAVAAYDIADSMLAEKAKRGAKEANR